MPEFSVVTIVKGRRKQLANLLDSIKASTLLPYDIQIVCMDKADGIKVPEGLNVGIHSVSGAQGLPLAAARNLGFASTKTDQVVFVDVDCIVSPTLFAHMLQDLQAENVISAYPLYLPIVPGIGNWSELKPKAVAHPAREAIPAGQPVEPWRFWSLIFAIQKQAYEKIGGFDESFIGYGAEDTDFAMMFHQLNISLIFVRDYGVHQYHVKHDPPLDHFDSIIQNARRYQQKWGALPMQRWLNAFAELGLITIGGKGRITVIQKPTEEQIRNSVSPYPY